LFSLLVFDLELAGAVDESRLLVNKLVLVELAGVVLYLWSKEM
jgi:hypothetical protein